MFNFLEIAAQLRGAGALVNVADCEALARQLWQILNETEERQRMGSAGLVVLRANQGSLARLLEGVESLLAR
ncbi:3-deoxy-D-manno-octulosonic acid transferase [compost metagenome]